MWCSRQPAGWLHEQPITQFTLKGCRRFTEVPRHHLLQIAIRRISPDMSRSIPAHTAREYPTGWFVSGVYQAELSARLSRGSPVVPPANARETVEVASNSSMPSSQITRKPNRFRSSN